MNLFQSIDCLVTKGLLDADRAYEIKQIITSLPSDRSSLYQLVSGTTDLPRTAPEGFVSLLKPNGQRVLQPDGSPIYTPL